MKPNGINRAQEAGFSLIELLVSLALLGMVAAILASGLSLGQGSWRRSEEKAQASRSMFDAQTALRRLIENMQPLRSGSQGSGSQGLRSQASGSQASGSQASGSQGSGYQDLRAIEFRGSADELDGIVPLPPISVWADSIACIFLGTGARGASILPCTPTNRDRRPRAATMRQISPRSQARSTAWSFAISAKPREKRRQIGEMSGRTRKSFRHSFQ
jgi:prepilin-type N-terminal cleavage/methylation domain-containing protein